MSMAIKKIADFINNDIWSFRIDSISPRKSVLIKIVRVVVLSVRNFFYDQCYLRASAITFYSMLSVVPVVAMLIGVAKGFGYEQVLKKYLMQRFTEQQQVIEKIFMFAESMLETSKGGVVAGIGVILLFWAAIKLVSNIESSFNYIWRVPQNRPFFNKVSYYLVLLLIAPFVIIVSSSANVFLRSNLYLLLNKLTMIQDLALPLVAMGLKLVPYLLMWILFCFLYKFLPNTRVSIASAIIGGIIAGTVFQFLQEFYIVIQMAVFSKYKAIYGSFSTLPLFLLWLQFTWLIVLFGAEVVFAHQNAETFELEIFTDKISIRSFKAYVIRTASMIVHNFMDHGKPMDINAISMKAHMSIGLTRRVLDVLVETEIIFEAMEKNSGRIVYQPACNAAELTLLEVITRIETRGIGQMLGEDKSLEKITSTIAVIDDCGVNLPENIKIKDLSFI